MRVLIVDDEPNIRRTLRTTIEAVGHAAEEAATSAAAMARLRSQAFDVALLDLRLGADQGLDLIGPMLGLAPRLAIAVITAHAAVDTAVEAMRRGAFDYLPKPFTPPQVRGLLARVEKVRGLDARVASLEDRVRAEVPEAELESPDPLMQRAFELARRAAPSDAVVLLRGESGTGKGVMARAVHAWSSRLAGPFVTVSCPSLSPELLEADLFGHVRGAFTGAVRDAPGKVATAGGGTLFLDEVGDLPPALQPKLLRFLQERKFERVGDPSERDADIRLIAATNRDLESAVASGQFREDLLYRLNVIEITLPPLRQRSDRLAIADRLLAFFGSRLSRPLLGYTPEAREAIARYAWPGNLRELRNAIERAVILADDSRIGLADLPGRIAAPPITESTTPVVVGGLVTLEQLEVEHIRRILASTSGREEAARILGIDPSTLYRKRKQFGI